MELLRNRVIVNPHILVRTTNEWFLPAGATFRAGSASENQRLQLMLVVAVHWWPAPVCVGGLLPTRANSSTQSVHWFQVYYNDGKSGIIKDDKLDDIG